MKRANGTGSIVKLPGKRRRPYAVKISQKNRYGQVVQKILSYHEKAADAQYALAEYNRLHAAGRTPEIDKINTTLQEIYDGWSARAYNKIGEHTALSYKAAWNRRVSRYADRKIRSISLDDWQAILDEDETAGKSQSLINNDAYLIKSLCAYAMERDIIVKDYSVYLDIPSVDIKNPRNALSDIQLAKLWEMAVAGIPWADTAIILCYTGFRVSEFLALSRFSYHPEHGGYLQGGMKTDAGRNRIVPVHPKIKPYLMRWLQKGGETIFCKEDGNAMSSVAYRELFAGLMSQIGAEGATPHWCRHTFATRLHAAKADPLVTKWLLGHSTKSDITAHYTHQSIGLLVEGVRLLA